MAVSAIAALCTLDSSAQETPDTTHARLLEEAIVKAVRAQKDAPFAVANVDRESLGDFSRTGREIPFLLSSTPGVLSWSENGVGTGTTYMRIRGAGDSRINVTIDGVPLNSPEMAKSGNTLLQLGLDKTDDQLGTVIGAKALVAGEILQNCSSRGYNGVGQLLKKESVSYALCYDLDASMAKLGITAENGARKFDPTNLVEFQGTIANKGLVLKWDNEYKKINYGKFTSQSKDRDIVGKTVEEKLDSVASTLNAIFTQTENEALKDLKAVAFDDCVVILFGVKNVEAKSTDKSSKDTEEVKDILAGLKEIAFLKSGKTKYAIDNLDVLIIVLEQNCRSHRLVVSP